MYNTKFEQKVTPSSYQTETWGGDKPSEKKLQGCRADKKLLWNRKGWDCLGNLREEQGYWRDDSQLFKSFCSSVKANEISMKPGVRISKLNWACFITKKIAHTCPSVLREHYM